MSRLTRLFSRAARASSLHLIVRLLQGIHLGLGFLPDRETAAVAMPVCFKVLPADRSGV